MDVKIFPELHDYDTEKGTKIFPELHDYDTEKGTAFVYFGSKVRSIQVRVLKIEDNQIRKSYLRILEQTAESSFTVRCRAFFQPDLVCVDYFKHTMKSLMEMETTDYDWFKDWWICSGKKIKKWRMQPIFQNIIRQLIIAFGVLEKEGLFCDFDLDSIVFCDDTKYLSELRLINVREATGEDGSLWNNLIVLLDKIIEKCKACQSNFDVRDEVTNFMNMILESDSHDIMTQHPALLTERERLDFIMKVRDEFHRGGEYKIPFDYRLDKFQYWENTVKDIHFDHMQSVYKVWEKKSWQTWQPQHIRFAAFIRDCYEHLTSPANVEAHGYYDLSKFKYEVDNFFPNFASYLFECHVRHMNLKM